MKHIWIVEYTYPDNGPTILSRGSTRIVKATVTEYEEVKSK